MSTDSPKPERAGPYVIEEQIGAGGMGTVYRARHADTNDVVAVKILPASLARESGFVARFNREIQALRRLSSPWIVNLYDSGITEDETCYYAMELVEGETVIELLRRERRLTWQQTIELSHQIALALKAAHDAGIIHRDLKPSNLLVTPDAKIKLTDFGVAQVFAGTRLTRTGGVVGTAEYMSPRTGTGKTGNKAERPVFAGRGDVRHADRPTTLCRHQYDGPVAEAPVWSV